MYVRPIKRICDVRGCKNKDCYSISRVREAGNTVVICKSCLGRALSALDEPQVVQAKVKKPIPTLFFNDAAFPEEGEVKVVPDENVENLVTQPDTEEEVVECEEGEVKAQEDKPKATKKAAKKGE